MFVLSGGGGLGRTRRAPAKRQAVHAASEGKVDSTSTQADVRISHVQEVFGPISPWQRLRGARVVSQHARAHPSRGRVVPQAHRAVVADRMRDVCYQYLVADAQVRVGRRLVKVRVFRRQEVEQAQSHDHRAPSCHLFPQLNLLCARAREAAMIRSQRVRTTPGPGCPARY